MMLRLLVGKIFIGAIRIYQLFLSPLFAPCCRFYPTCSEYAITAIDRHGPWSGFARSAWRILRCHPFSSGGYDPVEQ